jgi:hypothetical protein
MTALLGVLGILAGQVEAASGGTVEARHCLPMDRWALEDLRELDAAAEQLKQSAYFDILMRTSGVEISVDDALSWSLRAGRARHRHRGERLDGGEGADPV